MRFLQHSCVREALQFHFEASWGWSDRGRMRPRSQEPEPSSPSPQPLLLHPDLRRVSSGAQTVPGCKKTAARIEPDLQSHVTPPPPVATRAARIGRRWQTIQGMLHGWGPAWITLHLQGMEIHPNGRQGALLLELPAGAFVHCCTRRLDSTQVKLIWC